MKFLIRKIQRKKRHNQQFLKVIAFVQDFLDQGNTSTLFKYQMYFQKSFINKEDSKDLTDNSLILSDDKNPKKLKKIKSYEKLTLLINE
jgi:hypothetical protein